MAKTQLTKNTTTGNWELTETNQGQTYTNTLLTDNQNISGDIKINITAKTGSEGTPVAEKGTVSSNKVTITPKVTNTEGYIAGGTKSGTAITVTASELVSGTLTPTSSGVKDVTNYASVNISAGTAGTPVAEKETVSSNKITITPKVTNSAGWISTGTISGTGVTVTASELVSGSKAISANGTSVDVTNYKYVDVAVPTGITPTGNITITKQSATDVTQYATADVRAGSAAINNVSVSATVSSLSVAYDSTNTRFNVTGSSVNTGAISANVSTAGWISSVTGATATANATVSATLPRVALGADITNGGARRPTISRTAKPSADTWTDAANGSATTTKPTSGVYVQVNSASNTVTLTAAAKVSTAGYGTTAQYGVTNATTTVGASASSNTYIPIKTGSVTQPDTTFNASSVTLEDDLVTLQAQVTPSVSAGYITSGTSGTITIQGTITVPTFKKVTVTASSSQIYVVKGSVTIKAKNSAEGTGTTISDTYFKITSIATSSYQGGSYQTVVTYQTMKVYTSGSAPDWDSATTVAYGSLSSGGTCVLQFECGQGVVAKCSSTATSIAYYSDGSVTSGQYVYTMPYQIDAKRKLCWYYLYVKCSSATNTRCLFYPYLGISYIQNYKPTASSARSTMTIRYRYSTNGSSYTSDSCSATASSSGQYTGSFDLYARYYPISEYL